MHKFFIPHSLQHLLARYSGLLGTVLITIFLNGVAQSTPLLFQNSEDFSSQNIKIYLQRFVQESHPMGTSAQKNLAQDIEDTLSSIGLTVKRENFTAVAPSIYQTDKKKVVLKNTMGINLIANKEGKSHCALIFGGHFDTKFFADKLFVGANDGGSSTAFLIELARIIQLTHFPKNSLGSCSIYFVFFDGEESLLPNWNDGQKTLNIQDNLYGSRTFVDKNIITKNLYPTINRKIVKLALIVDMIGHKGQNLFITQGSDSNYAQSLIESCSVTKISKAPLFMEDDHYPFLQKNVPTLHIIDWTNLNEWHTEKDNLEILSYEKIANFGRCVKKFLRVAIKLP